jgi:hypothetical protein
MDRIRKSGVPAFWELDFSTATKKEHEREESDRGRHDASIFEHGGGAPDDGER